MKLLKKLIWLYIFVYGFVLNYIFVTNDKLYIGVCILLVLINTFLVFIMRRDEPIIKKIIFVIIQLILGLILSIRHILVFYIVDKLS
jgi:ABC-type iron transport system FetAB permease component